MGRKIHAESKNILFDLLKNNDASKENIAILDGLDAIERLEMIDKLIQKWKSSDYQNSKNYVYEIAAIVYNGTKEVEAFELRKYNKGDI